MLLDDMAQRLRKAEHKLTQPRLAILQVLSESDEYLDPKEVCRRGRAHYPLLGLATVYRTLEILDELGVVRRVHTGGKCHAFARANLGRHYLVCHHCSRVTELPCVGIEAFLRMAQERLGYTVEDHLVELIGVCPECKADE